MAIEIAFILVVFLVAAWGFSQEKHLKRYQVELSRTKEETAALKSRLEDRFYLETIFSSMEEEVMLINRYMEITDVNPAIEKAVGLSKEEIMGKHCYEILHNRTSPCQPPHGPCPFEEVFETGEGKKAMHIHLGPQEEELVVEMSATPIKDESGKVIQIIEISRNITEREQLKEQIIRTEKLKLIENFMGDVHHDIIDPLNVISSNLQLIQLKWKLKADESEKINDMINQAGKINKTIDNLLDFIKGPALVVSEIDINEIIRKVLDLVEKEIALEETELHVELFEGPLFVSGKSGELGQAFLNLIASARETMSRVPVTKEAVTEKDGWKKTLTISTKLTSDKANIVVEIKDTGIEIPKNLIAKLPDPLYLPERNFSTLFRSLSACYKIVLNHWGNLVVSSSTTEGTVYRINLPASRKES